MNYILERRKYAYAYMVYAMKWQDCSENFLQVYIYIYIYDIRKC